jgi:hypothetical protein
MIMYSIDIEMSVTDRESSPTPPPIIPNSEDYPADAVGMMFSYILKASVHVQICQYTHKIKGFNTVDHSILSFLRTSVWQVFTVIDHLPLTAVGSSHTSIFMSVSYLASLRYVSDSTHILRCQFRPEITYS